MKYDEDDLFIIDSLNKIQELEKILWLIIKSNGGEARIALADIEDFNAKNCYVEHTYSTQTHHRIYRALLRRKP